MWLGELNLHLSPSRRKRAQYGCPLRRSCLGGAAPWEVLLEVTRPTLSKRRGQQCAKGQMPTLLYQEGQPEAQPEKGIKGLYSAPAQRPHSEPSGSRVRAGPGRPRSRLLCRDDHHGAGWGRARAGAPRPGLQGQAGARAPGGGSVRRTSSGRRVPPGAAAGDPRAGRPPSPSCRASRCR